MLCAGCLSFDWLLTESLSEIQSSSLGETGMRISFTSALLQQIFTEIKITNANCPIKEKKKSAEDNLKYFLIFPENSVLQFMQTVSFY